MARQEDTCWRCGTQWASDDEPRTALRVVHGGVATRVAGAPRRRIPATVVAADARAVTEGRLDEDRWIDEGGSWASEAAALTQAAAERR